MKILSIQSSVAYGHVGNSAAVFPLQRLGHEVWPVLTVHFSNHTGYGAWRGPLLAPDDVREVIAGIEDRGVLGQADAVLSGYQGDPAVGGVILNKPADRADAERMIRLQEGRDTEVLTALCLYRAERREWVGAVESSLVRFRRLTDAERAAHLDSGKWAGKAGAYGVQDDDPFVHVAAGSWSNVVGLPMERLADLLRRYPGLNE